VAQPGQGAAESPGLLASLRRLASSLAGALQTRLELFATEIEEERVRLARLLLLGVIASFFLALGMLTLTLFFIVLFWDTHRLLVTGLLAVIYFSAGLAVAYALRREAAAGSQLFSASLSELAKDRERLNSQ
jgi:uncharacterized membrane protein YqjE